MSKKRARENSNSHGIKYWLMAFRPKTLTAALVPVLVGTVLAYRFGSNYNVWIALCALLSALFIQIGTNLFNDAIDFHKGADTEERLGPQRVTQSGLISSRWVMIGGTIFFILAVLFGIPLVLRGGWTIVIIGLISLSLGYGYTGGPFPLAYKGFGDIFVILFFGLVAVGGVYFLHTGKWSLDALVAGLQVGLLSTVLIAINNFRDIDSDRKVNKKTLAVRWGCQFARWEIRFLFLFSFFLSIYWFKVGIWGAAFLPLFVWPLAKKVMVKMDHHPTGSNFNECLAKAGLIQFLFGVYLSVGFLLS